MLICGVPLRAESVAFPEDTVCISLYGSVLLGILQTLHCPPAVVAVDFNATEMPAKLACHNSCGAAAEEGVEYALLLCRRCEDELGVQLLRLLGGMIGILRHRPERNADVVPEV